MKVTVAAFAYNERPYIPYMVDYYRDQGCDLFIIDNYSTDGTYEWLVENNVRTIRVDTNESFHLKKLQYALGAALVNIRPDWVVYCGVDCYYHFRGTIVEEVQKAEQSGCSIIEIQHYSIYNTGERFQLPFPSTYFYGQRNRNLQMIGKYSPQFRFVADSVAVPNKKVYSSDGIFLNYGMCKPKEERERTYARRQKAWKLGEDRGHGVHYRPAQQHNWIWNKKKLIDIRTTSFYNMILWSL
jgi:glycosyltransferase involved in cell wall biosynthesis